MTLSLFEDAPAPDPVAVNTEPWKTYGPVTIYHGDCIEVLKRMPRNSVDSGVTDPPYGIGFMGKEWDTFDPDAVAENTRKGLQAHHGFNLDDPRRTNPNLKGRERSPAMSPSQIEYDRTLDGQRGFQRFTQDWAIEMYRVLKPGGHLLVCGAPRSAHRMVCGLEDAGFEIRDSFAWLFGQGFPKSRNLRDEDNEKTGWGSALKPGHEPIAVAQKPFDCTLDENVARWGVGALNINGSLVTGDRWPANVLLDEEAAAQLDVQTGELVSGANPTRRGSEKFQRIFQRYKGSEVCTPARGADSGGASRFFFVAKPSRAERDFGCENLPMRTAGECTEREDGSAGLTPYAGAGRSGGGRNFHPTVKPVALMRWLVKLVTPPGGTVLDNFLGSGTTGMACLLEGFNFVGIEKEAEYLPVSDARMSAIWREVA